MASDPRIDAYIAACAEFARPILAWLRERVRDGDVRGVPAGLPPRILRVDRRGQRPETKAKRVAEAVGWIREGKRRNWKYESC